MKMRREIMRRPYCSLVVRDTVVCPCPPILTIIARNFCSSIPIDSRSFTPYLRVLPRFRRGGVMVGVCIIAQGWPGPWSVSET